MEVFFVCFWCLYDLPCWNHRDKNPPWAGKLSKLSLWGPEVLLDCLITHTHSSLPFLRNLPTRVSSLPASYCIEMLITGVFHALIIFLQRNLKVFYSSCHLRTELKPIWLLILCPTAVWAIFTGWCKTNAESIAGTNIPLIYDLNSFKCSHYIPNELLHVRVYFISKYILNYYSLYAWPVFFLNSWPVSSNCDGSAELPQVLWKLVIRE